MLNDADEFSKVIVTARYTDLSLGIDGLHSL